MGREVISNLVPDSPPFPIDTRSRSSTLAQALPNENLSSDVRTILWNYARELSSSVGATTVPGITIETARSPPRQLFRAVPTYEVIGTKARDRFLFVLTDLLILAKPLTDPEGNYETLGLADLSWTFSIKAILDLRQVSLEVNTEQARTTRPHPLMKSLINRFGRDAEGALRDLIARSGLVFSPEAVAQLLIQTPDLEKEALTRYLCSNPEVLSEYVNRLHFATVPLDMALRMVLLLIRFPTQWSDLEQLLVALINAWTIANTPLVSGLTGEAVKVLVYSMIQLNFAIHDPKRYPQSQHDWIDLDRFLTKVRNADPGRSFSNNRYDRYTNQSCLNLWYLPYLVLPESHWKKIQLKKQDSTDCAKWDPNHSGLWSREWNDHHFHSETR